MGDAWAVLFAEVLTEVATAMHVAHPCAFLMVSVMSFSFQTYLYTCTS